ncbi:MAG: prepilin-type N-terminal cleavage/methylation domain-containing protein [Opitutaceae bacterium]|jgi:prepilin-type N-terminal cleavage/methylation domain-containing protein/prepilin-type processing-associated H-X9-DG protein|nr:prepilin-type N-terminal cleavage/methylation domain-containing protein [Opitutaceae bacterium]
MLMHTADPILHISGQSRPASHAFTLIELLTVIAIIGILAAIIIPTVGKVRQTAQRAACASNLRQIGTAVIAYATDNKDWLPGGEKTGQGWYGLNATAGPKGWYENGMPTGDLCAWIYSYLGVTRNGSPFVVPIFVCPGNREVKDSYALHSGASDQSGITAAYYIGAKARLKTTTAMTRPIGYDGKRSARITDIENPQLAPLLFDQDVEMGSIGMTNQKNQAIAPAATSGLPLTAVHGNVRNVVYYDAHVKALPKNTDPHEK